MAVTEEKFESDEQNSLENGETTTHSDEKTNTIIQNKVSGPPKESDVILELQKKVKALENRAPEKSTDISVISEVIKGLQSKTDAEKYGNGYDYVDEADIDTEDILDKQDAVTFFAHKTGYVIVDDKRSGLPVRTPFRNKLVFKYQATRKRQVGKEVELFNFAVYTSYSKKEVQWLRDHSLFGVMFFAKADQALNVNARKASKLIGFMQSLQRMGQYELVKMSEAHGIEMMEKPQDIRIAIANKLADEEMAREKTANEVRLDETQKAKDLLGIE